ncbi:2-oxoglutarate dehydrogenase, E2 component, dihydrolipoamide succinyltransferase [Corynebacterium minutissimum]|uniref:Dihydrolipoamide acetyltransferase component of pyruvate dehydrogenase complex n=1 Tax=Corynebacterium minutissimum TaxID=38301 RepID=A0A2X4UMZ1_9CORY|nr:2-oxoglutarate dehydrogenase, E2 component, dihydrolipoamide succinyltransferase [Corynebacterium minutissimum]KHO29173.1 pyruvate dehydrogenase [Corynebacterium minutissimum]QPS59325.1 2-oxoglutarate dehydrogenase, E2 component, dihydrolipoamide succinyltransferase [Corynebacterium minutissimum]QQA79886.1 2-oxoglutarate dehydrogenase, E2 component, dihydrolipoamide succinyltransferase [Corynebacterium minutissimum]SQH99344.1 Dihydrolipoamide acyltransferase [Corynebacterium minutissimum]VE
MAHSVVMPELGESVTEGTITQWLKSVGDTVEADEPLLEVSTDKVDTEVPSPVSGTILEIKADEDDTIDVGEVIAIIGDEGESAPAADESDSADSSEKAEETPDKPAEDAESEAAQSGDATDVEMPELGESVTEGTITQWLKSVGDTVEVDEPLLEVSTDKVDTEIPSPVAGTLLEILADEDDTVDVGAVIARVGDGSAAASEKPAAKEDKTEEKKEEPKAEAKEETSEDKPAASGDATDVEMPELGESVTEGTITQWLKSVGDTVEVDEPLLEVSTDKVDTEIPSPVAGTLLEILADEDDTVDVGAVIARVGDGSAAASEKPAAKEEKKEEPKAEEKKEEPKAEEKKEEPKADEKAEEKKPAASSQSSEPKASETSTKVNNGDNVPYVTPLVRKLAEKHGVDLSTVSGTGVGGRIRKQDVLAAAGEGEAPASSAGTGSSNPRARWSTKSVDPEKQELIGTTQKVNRIREITASKMVEALQISAQLTHVQEVDMTAIWDLRKQSKQAFIDKYEANLSFLPFIVKATVEALVSHPNVNASYNPETKEMTYHADVNVAIAVDTPKGLLTPVIHKAQELTLPEIAQQIAELADKARNNKLKPNDLTGATFTVTNIGSEGALLDTPILVPPQAGILGTAAITKRAVVVTEDGQDAIAIRQMCYLPFTYDHQVVDGADAGRFITTIKDRLETADFDADLNL